MTMYETLNIVIQVAVVVGVFLTLIVYHRILEATKAASRAQGTLSVVQMIQAEEIRAARSHIYTNAQPFKYSDWNDDDKDKASMVCAVFDLAAILVDAGTIDADTLLVNWGPTMTRCHAVCLPFIQERQRENPRFYSQFQKLNARVKKEDRWTGEEEYEKNRANLASVSYISGA